MKNKYLYIANQRKDISEGGMSRNNAFYKYFKKSNYDIHNAYHKIYFKRFLKNTKLLFSSFFFVDKKIFFHQSSLLLIFPMFTWKYLGFIYAFYLKRLAKKNNLYIEINDLPLEQAIDLELKISKNYVYFQNIIYSVKNCHYIYASNEMEKYNRKKYGQDAVKNQIIINGGNTLSEKNSVDKIEGILYDQNKINFIYAGSLNKGRQIEWLINLFSDLNENLYLIGDEGEWIDTKQYKNNIFYLGSFNEDHAQIITSKCDIGIIPYDESKFYYNLCYPTKASFYLCAQIPILSTRLTELSNVLDGYDVCYYSSTKDFSDTMKKLSKESIEKRKEDIKKISKFFTWDEIFKNLKID